jgi:hypothetical protein
MPFGKRGAGPTSLLGLRSSLIPCLGLISAVWALERDVQFDTGNGPFACIAAANIAAALGGAYKMSTPIAPVEQKPAKLTGGSDGKLRSIGILLMAEVAAMSLWFVTAAVLPDMLRGSPLSPFRQAAMSSGVQAGFVIGALLSAIFGLADRYDPHDTVAGRAAVGVKMGTRTGARTTRSSAVRSSLTRGRT